MKDGFLLMTAPLQGLTTPAWREVHKRMFGEEQGEVEYFTPFIRVERGEVRRHDLRDFAATPGVTPQIIFKDEEEWQMLVTALRGMSARRIDMNLGCPFVPQVRKGRGAGLLRRPDLLARIVELMQGIDDIDFSVKMRLGVDDAGDWQQVADIINDMPLRHVVVHPRTARQQYKGELDMEEVADFASKIKHKLIFNGEIWTPDAITRLEGDWDGVMVGRGLITRPSLFAEWRSGNERSEEQREMDFEELLGEVAAIESTRLCGPAQLRERMKAYWEYAPDFMDRKKVKAARKGHWPG